MNDEKLFTQFPPVPTELWEEAIRVDLKGQDYDKKLVWKTIEGFNVRPYYREENLKDIVLNKSNKQDNSWDIRQDIFEKDILLANAIAQQGIKRGVNSLGLDATNIKSEKDLELLLKDIDITKVKINFTGANCFWEITNLFISFVKSHNIDKDKVYGSLNFDPFVKALYSGGFCCEIPEIGKRAAELIKLVKENIPNFDVITINGQIFNNAGSSIVQELAYSLSAANEYIYCATSNGALAHSVGYRMVISFATGSNYFMEIAKIRAARILFKRIMEQYNPKCETAFDVFIATQSSFYNKTIYDPYVNMLRTTTETMSSAIAGADSISVYPFDCAFKESDDFSRRIASNQQILLKEETYLDKVVDPSSGSYYIENLTNSICEAAWNIFKEIEEKGGFLSAIKEGFIQDEIEKTSSKRSNDAAMRKTSILGTNQYPNLNEKMSEKISSVCEGVENKKDNIRTLSTKRLSQDFETLRLNVEKADKKPKVFLLTYGNLAMRKARSGFATNFFGIAGYDIIDNIGFSSIEEGANKALESKSDIIVLCSSDDEYKELVQGVMPLLKDKVKHIVVAGYPESEVENFKQQGITDFIHVRTNALESLKNYNKLLGL
ncbi:MAG: methylmalonyl-CoA mutase family protein [Bacteroidales bacterium]|jgi:methylmalonyl-CoA mutase|nr:methylmalonyl-CoA mutase family protein [Bacteroidales bacterium]